MLLGFTVRVASDVDPSAVVFASRAAGEDWFCFEQPDRDGSALAALGTVTRLQASGADRFARVAAAWRELTAGAVADAPDGPPGAGLVAARRLRLRARRRPRAALGRLRLRATWSSRRSRWRAAATTSA